MLLFHFSRIADLTENMQMLGTKIQAFEKRELMSMEEMNKSVEMINEINLNIKEYLDEIEVMFIEFPLYGSKTLLQNTPFNACLTVSRTQPIFFFNFLRTSTVSRVCWKRGRLISQ